MRNLWRAPLIELLKRPHRGAGAIERLACNMISCESESMENEKRISVSLSTVIGLAVIGFGLVFNEVVIGRALSADGKIDSSFLRVLILTIQFMLFAVGVHLIRRRHLPSATRELLLTAASLTIAIVLGIAAVQMSYTPPTVVSGWRPATLAPGWIHAGELNELGFRGQPIRYTDEDFVVVVLGDSQAEAKACAYGWMPERRLEYYLNHTHAKRSKVFTIGATGYGQDQQLLVLREYFNRYRADLVLLWQTPENDIWNNVFPTHWPANGTPKPTFMLEHGELRGPSEGMEEPVSGPSLKVLALLKNLLPHQGRDEQWEPKLPPAYRPLVSYEGAVNQGWQHLPPDENLETEKSHMSIFLTPRSERMQYGLDLTRKLLQEMQSQATSQRSKLVLFHHDHERSLVSHVGEEVYVVRGKYYRASDAQREANIAYMAEGFRSHTVRVTVPDFKVGPADPHLNEHAVDQVMRDLANMLADLIPNSV